MWHRGSMSFLLAAAWCMTGFRCCDGLHLANVGSLARCCGRVILRGAATSWLFSSRRQALTLLEKCTAAAMCCLTFELSGRRRQDARPGPVKMYRVPPARAWWPAVGAPLERGVRHHRARPLTATSHYQCTTPFRLVACLAEVSGLP